MLRTAELGDTQIVLGDLVEAFTGDRATQELTNDNLRARSLENVSAAMRLFNPGHSPRQVVLDGISREASQGALVILAGPGGSGKTTALTDWVDAVTKAAPPKIGAVAWFLFASGARLGLISHVICECSKWTRRGRRAA
jgi:ABC-type glutathione transport system ATPase component